MEITDDKTNLLFGVFINESVVLDVGGATVLICLFLLGKILHSFLQSDVSHFTVDV